MDIPTDNEYWREMVRCLRSADLISDAKNKDFSVERRRASILEYLRRLHESPVKDKALFISEHWKNYVAGNSEHQLFRQLQSDMYYLEFRTACGFELIRRIVRGEI